MVVLESIKRVITPPMVSIPRLKGVTSKSNTSYHLIIPFLDGTNGHNSPHPFTLLLVSYQRIFSTIS
jgi:hypothetical protein